MYRQRDLRTEQKLGRILQAADLTADQTGRLLATP